MLKHQTAGVDTLRKGGRLSPVSSTIIILYLNSAIQKSKKRSESPLVIPFATNSTVRERRNGTLVRDQKQKIPDVFRKACRGRTYPKLNRWTVTAVSHVERLSARVREKQMRTGVCVSKQNNLAFLSQARILPANPLVQPHEKSD
jgi:hypothetical protein